MKNIVTLTIFIIFIGALCYGQSSYKYAQPETLDDQWKTNTLKSQKDDTASIYKMFDQIKNMENKVHSVLLVKDGQLIIEEYFKQHPAAEQHDLRSMTKSIRSILMGIAIDRGFIDNVNDPISKYLKNTESTKNRDERKGKITINHLLTMSSGLDW